MARQKEMERIPVGADSKFEFEGKDPNYFYYVVNSRRPGRLQKFLNAGYEFCYNEQGQHKEGVGETSKMDSRITMDLGLGDVGYLMRLPKKYRKEDMAAKRKLITSIEDQMKPNKTKNQYGDGLTDT